MAIDLEQLKACTEAFWLPEVRKQLDYELNDRSPFLRLLPSHAPRKRFDVSKLSDEQVKVLWRAMKVDDV